MPKPSTISFFLWIILLIAACRKMDTLSLRAPNNATAEKWFKLPVAAPLEIRRIAQKLEQLNQQHGFLKTIGRQDGLPVWDKAVFNIPQAAARSAAEQGSATLGDTIVYIPLVLENANFVNAFIYAKLNDSVQLQLHSGKEYVSYGFGNVQDDTDNAERLALQIMMLDKAVFGHTRFRLLDNRLFEAQSGISDSGVTAPRRFLTIEENGANTSAPARSAARWEPATVTTCTHTETLYHCNHRGLCRSGVCDGCGDCVTPGSSNCVTVVQYYFVADDDDWGGGGGSIESGGGGGAGGTSSGPAPCNPNPELDNGLPPCPRGGGDGWIPELDDFSQTPCEKAQESARKMDSLFTKSKVDSVLASIPNLATETNEKGFPIIQKFSVNPYNVHDTTFTSSYAGSVQTGTDSSIIIQASMSSLEVVAAFLHTHPPSGYAAQSAKDVYDIIQQSLQNPYYQGAFVYSANGDNYALTLSDRTKAAAFLATMAQNLDGSKWKEDSNIGKAFAKAYEYYSERVYENNSNKKNLAYEKAMAAVLKQFNTGIILNKKDTNGNFKPLVINTIVTPKQGIFGREKTDYTQDCL